MYHPVYGVIVLRTSFLITFISNSKALKNFHSQSTILLVAIDNKIFTEKLHLFSFYIKTELRVSYALSTKAYENLLLCCCYVKIQNYWTHDILFIA